MKNEQKIGFTLIETLVTISIIAILLGITLPVLRSVKRAADASMCRSNLMAIGQVYVMYANDHTDLWPNLLPRWGEGEPESLDFEWGASAFRIWPGHQVNEWAWPLHDYLPGEGPDVKLDYGQLGSLGSGVVMDTPGARLQIAEKFFSCPTVYGDRVDFEIYGGPGFADPGGLSSTSYLHNAALFTRANAWLDPDATVDTNPATTNVRHSDVAHPSRKVNLVEAHTHHERNTYAGIGSGTAVGSVNLLAADGHAEMRGVADAAPPISYVVPNNFFGYSGPFRRLYVTTERGYEGVDW